MAKNRINRPVRPIDFLIVLLDFVHNILETFTVLIRELIEIASYHTYRETEVSRAWEEFANDLEKIQEDDNGDAR